jgi:hypothetical protein
VAEREQAKLDRTGVIKAGFGLKVHMQALGEWLQPLDSLRPVEKCRRSGREQEEIGEPAPVNVVDQLAQSVQALLAHVATDSLKRLDLVEDEDQPRIARTFQDQEQSAQEAQGGEMVNVSLDPSHSFD